MVEINKSTELARYTSLDNEYGRKLNALIPGYKVKMGFGLHIGWAIEGAIGSDQKIDASYLSPQVRCCDAALNLMPCTRL